MAMTVHQGRKTVIKMTVKGKKRDNIHDVYLFNQESGNAVQLPCTSIADQDKVFNLLVEAVSLTI